MADSDVRQKIIDHLKDSNNILITVNTNPTVDQLSAALGLALLLDKLDKHATAIFSGEIPPAIEFLNPEKTFENTVNSLRDFIIALDKEKADHLRYKVDGDVVKIFITPYRTTISQDDLDFSQGDYNVEMVVAIGVQNDEDLDRALESHGRIMHDATVAAVSIEDASNMEGLQWTDAQASSYSELLAGLADDLKTDKKLLDEQSATAFLTGIVAATDRFSNGKTSSKVMTVAATLMAAGANQQLIATKLEEGRVVTVHTDTKTDSVEPDERRDETPEKSDTSGSLAISHEPKGTLEDVEKQVRATHENAAKRRAEEELERQASEMSRNRQEEARSEAEDQLADHLKQSPEPESLKGPTNLDQWQNRDHHDEPSFGGTLNATTEEAAEDKRREIADERNHKILTHDNSSYMSTTPSYQSPLNGTNAPNDQEQEVRDIFAETSNITTHADPIQPPAPALPPVVPLNTPFPLGDDKNGQSSHPGETLADIDRANRGKDHSDALNDVHAAFGNNDHAPSSPMLPQVQPLASESNSTGGSSGGGLPDLSLPSLPPMPDFSTLPPLPGGQLGSTNSPAPSSGGQVPSDTLGSLLPPAEPNDAAQSNGPRPYNPQQFTIPGQK